MEGSRDGDGVNYRNKSCSKWHWRHDEDQLLVRLVHQHGARKWNFIAANIHGRSGKSCRLRWVNQLNPEVNKAPFDMDEEEKLLRLHQIHGNKWSTIAKFFPGRTDNQLKNQYHIIKARKKKRVLRLPFTGRSQDQSTSSTMGCGSIFRHSLQKRGLISGSPSNLSRLRSALWGTRTSTPQLYDHSGTGIDNNFISSPWLTTTRSNGLCPPLNYVSSFSSFHDRYNESNAAAFLGLSRVVADYAGGFSLGRNCDNQGTGNSQSISSNFISALPPELNKMIQRESRDESMKHKDDGFIDFLGVENSD